MDLQLTVYNYQNLERILQLPKARQWGDGRGFCPFPSGSLQERRAEGSGDLEGQCVQEWSVISS